MRRWHEPADHLVQTVRSGMAQSRRPFVVAIDGRSGAGKSTLAAEVAKTLDAAVVAGDDFFAGGTGVRDDDAAELADICIDWRAQRQVLLSLRESGFAEYHPYDWDAFDGSRCAAPRSVVARPVIILEGVYSGRPELRDLLDLLVLVEVPPDRRMRQLVGREGELGAWEMQWHRAEDWYFEVAAPRHCFDVIICPLELSQVRIGKTP